ncbi:MAG TPA: hypothetical protein VF295_05765 [Candidatus Limnocylindria bacterium]
MVGWGIFLIIVGAGSLLLPSLGYQFRLMELVDDVQPYAGIVVAVIGAALLFLGMTRGRQTTVEVNQRTAAGNEPVEAASDDRSRT